MLDLPRLRAPSRDTPTVIPLARAARPALAVNAAVAWTGVVLTAVISTLGGYAERPVEPGLYGDTPDGFVGAGARLLDTLSYFTIWSNVVVAVSVTLLALHPGRDTLLRRVLRLDGLLMIMVTAIVYQVLLAPSVDLTGWSLLTDPILHVVTPLLTMLVWLVWGPRGWITLRLVPAALVVPALWVVWMLGRGAVIGSYPYDFADVSTLGYGTVLRTLALILVFALVVAGTLWAVDTLLRRGREASTDEVTRSTRPTPGGR